EVAIGLEEGAAQGGFEVLVRHRHLGLVAGGLVVAFLLARFLLAGFLVVAFLLAGFFVAGLLIVNFLIAGADVPRQTQAKHEHGRNQSPHGLSSRSTGEAELRVSATILTRREADDNALLAGCPRKEPVAEAVESAGEGVAAGSEGDAQRAFAGGTVSGAVQHHNAGV